MPQVPPIVSWLSLLIALVAAGLSCWGVITANRARKENTQNWVRNQQHEVIEEIRRQMDQLLTLLEDDLNYAVQGTNLALISSTAAEVGEIAEPLNKKTISNRKLRLLVNDLYQVMTRGDAGLAPGAGGLLGSISSLEQSLRDIENAIAADNMEQVVQAAGERGRQIEPLRVENSKAIALVNRIQQEANRLQVQGIGQLKKLPSRTPPSD